MINRTMDRVIEPVYRFHLLQPIKPICEDPHVQTISHFPEEARRGLMEFRKKAMKTTFRSLIEVGYHVETGDAFDDFKTG